MKVELTESAFGDIGSILRFYEEQAVPATGRRLVDGILKKCERLGKHPDSGRVVPEFGVHFLREVIDPPFRIIYQRDPGKVWIIRVWRSERILRLE